MLRTQNEPMRGRERVRFHGGIGNHRKPPLMLVILQSHSISALTILRVSVIIAPSTNFAVGQCVTFQRLINDAREGFHNYQQQSGMESQ